MRKFFCFKLAILLLFIDVHASEKIIHFVEPSPQIVDLESPIDETHLQYQPDKKNYFIRKATIENNCRHPLKNLYLLSNGMDFRDFNGILQSLGGESESGNFYRFYNWWKNVLKPIQENPACSLNPFHVLQFYGCADAVRNADCLAKVAGFLNIQSKIVPSAGHALREFYVDDEWRIFDGHRRLVYLNLDNRSLAGFDEVMDDPFLALRTKTSIDEEAWEIAQSALNFSQFEAFGAESYPEEEFCSQGIEALGHLAFDLYPGEKIVYNYDQSPFFEKHGNLNSIKDELGIVEQTILPSARCVDGDNAVVFRSPYPLYQIVNHSGGRIFLSGQKQVIEQGEAAELDEFPVFEVEIHHEAGAAGGQGKLLIACVGARTAFPTLKKGKNTLELGQECRGADVTFHFDDITTPPSSSLSILNGDSTFDHASPFFILKCDAPCDKIWWQISSQPDFQFVLPSLETIQSHQDAVRLDAMTETFLNSGQDYFFRFRGSHEGVWSDWSSPFSFKVIKPESPAGIQFEKTGQRRFKLSWKEDSDPETTYLVFASDSIHFIPSIYCDKQVEAIHSNEVSAWSENRSLILRTDQPLHIHRRPLSFLSDHRRMPRGLFHPFASYPDL